MAKEIVLFTPEESLAWLEQHGVSQAQVAEKVGCSKSVVNKLLKGTLQGRRGVSHVAAVALRLKAPAEGESPLALIPRNTKTRSPRAKDSAVAA